MIPTAGKPKAPELDRLENALGALATEAQNQTSLHLDLMPSADVVRAMHTADLEAVAAVQPELPSIAEAVDRIAQRIASGGRLFYLGAGTSGRLGVLDAAECPPTFNCSPDLVQGLIAGEDRALRDAVEGAEDDPALAQFDLAQRNFSSADTLVGIAASGRTPYVLGGIKYAREAGSLTIGLSCVPGSPLAAAADLAITPATGPEIVTGSTRLKAGTATKLVLNMISTGVMVRLGYVYGNLMVNVQTTNGKLRDRATRIVQALTSLDRDEAAALLEDAGSVRVAVIMHRLRLDRTTAAERLAAAKGRLREALNSSPSGAAAQSGRPEAS
jgi:N-acetylmuramic acid 6-phosphate etherase